MVEYQAAEAYADAARARARAAADPIDRALLATIAEGATIQDAADSLGIPRRTASDIVRRLMGWR